jgi:hypothetical protein
LVVQATGKQALILAVGIHHPDCWKFAVLGSAKENPFPVR